MTTAAETGTTVWKIDPTHALVEFSAKHMMITTVKGRFTGVEGAISVHAADPARSSVEARLEAASLSSGDERRDGHLKSPDFLDAATYPSITFVSTRVEPVRGAERFRVYGRLTIRDVTREVVLDAETLGRAVNPFGVEVAGFSATTQINRKDYGLNWNVALEAGGWLVGEEIKIVLEVEAVKQA